MSEIDKTKIDAFDVFKTLLLTRDHLGIKVVKSNSGDGYDYKLSMDKLVAVADDLQPYLKEWYGWQMMLARTKGTKDEEYVRGNYEKWYWANVLDGLDEEDIQQLIDSFDGDEDPCGDDTVEDDGEKDAADRRTGENVSKESAVLGKIADRMKKNAASNKRTVFLMIDGLERDTDPANEATVSKIVDLLDTTDCDIIALSCLGDEFCYASNFNLLCTLLSHKDLLIDDALFHLTADEITQILNCVDETAPSYTRWVAFGGTENVKPMVLRHVIPLSWDEPIPKESILYATAVLNGLLE